MSAPPPGPRPTPRGGGRPTPRGGPSPRLAPNELRGPENGNLLDSMKLALQRLDREVKTEEVAFQDLTRHLNAFARDKELLKKARDEAARVRAQFETSIGTFDQVYKEHLDNTHTAYVQQRVKHREATLPLQKDDTFRYHPAYKRAGDQFSGTYYTMPVLKQAEETKAREKKSERSNK
mmetsp:Transcript_75269/g.244766  ORF Transcript_75269/g.244766 Transcript_75269/m.244766 type:complete len:178 (+) Transcript_75269:102-635(+)